MRRYWIEKKQIFEHKVTFKGEQFHHIFDVCRQEVGHHFEVITEDSKAYVVEVLQVSKKEALAQIIDEREIKPLPLPHIHIALSIPRYAVLDSTIERATELGVSSILPFVSNYSFIRKTKELPAGKKERWDKIIVSATQQCGRGELMKIHPVVTMEEALQQINPNSENWCLFAYEGEKGQPIQEKLRALKNNIKEQKVSPDEVRPKNIWLIVGSEGGFSTSEVETMQKLGLYPVTIGSQILRVETACLTLVSVLKYEFGLMK